MYTRFDRRNLYVTYDVTRQLQDGANAVGILLGNGWYNHQSGAVWNFERAPWRNRPAFCFDLRIEYADGTHEVVKSDLDWRTSGGPLVFNSIYTSEHYDARLEQPGWSSPGFDDSAWGGVMYRGAPSQRVTAQQTVPIRNVTEYRPRSVRKLDERSYLYDFGQNMAGVTKLRLRGEAGTQLRLIHAERLREDGHADLSNIDVYFRPTDKDDLFQTDVVTLSGRDDEFMPRFNYKGFRYVEVVADRPVELSAENLTAYAMHSDVTPVGHIETSNDLVDKLWDATNKAYLSNLMGYPTDCPQREKNGWTGDGHLAIETALYNYDGITVYEKWLADHRDEQQPNGVLPDIIPTGGWGYGTANGLDWTSTIAIIPWNLYLFYGDTKPLEDCYENIKRYVDYVDRRSPGHLSSWGRGDWVPVRSQSSLELTSSVYFYVDATILARAAALFGREADRKHYEALAGEIRGAINDKYLDRATGIYASGTQTELSVPLMWGVVPEEMVAKVAGQPRPQGRRSRVPPRRRGAGRQGHPQCAERERPCRNGLQGRGAGHLSFVGMVDRERRHHAARKLEPRSHARHLGQPHDVRRDRRVVLQGAGRHQARPRSAGLQTHPAAPEFRRPRGIRGFARRPLRADRVGMDAPGQYGDLPRPNPGQQYRNALPAGQRGRPGRCISWVPEAIR